jgi:hypothetical protein
MRDGGTRTAAPLFGHRRGPGRSVQRAGPAAAVALTCPVTDTDAVRGRHRWRQTPYLASPMDVWPFRTGAFSPAEVTLLLHCKQLTASDGIMTRLATLSLYHRM